MNKISDNNWVQPLQRQNLGHLAYTSLRQALMEGRMKPGEELPLRPVSKSFGVSSTPMREAFLRLVAEHALELDSRGRISVPLLSKKELDDIRGIRRYLEGNAARHAAELATDDDIRSLREIHNSIAFALDESDFSRAVGHNAQFHLRICEISQLPISLAVVSNLWVRCGPLLSHLYDAGRPNSTGPHPHVILIDALVERDAQRAHDAIVEDIETHRAALDEFAK